MAIIGAAVSKRKRFELILTGDMMMKALRHILLAAGVCSGLALGLPQGRVGAEETAAAASIPLNINSQPLADALNAWAQQTGLQVIFPEEQATAGIVAPSVVGRFTARAGLERLLAGTGLAVSFINERTVAVSVVARATKLSETSFLKLSQMELTEKQDEGAEGQGSGDQDSASTPEKEEGDAERGGIPEILVTGSKVLNMNIKRNKDDIQPYVVFDRDDIESSAATTLEDFFKSNLTMSVSSSSASQGAVTTGNTSRINLRGLGADETLILVDGHRIAGLNVSGVPQQADINGIPLAAIERIEVLPTTASGIYGGNATGGAINIVLRRDYSGFSTKLTYGNTFESDATSRRVDIAAGLNFEDGKTNLLFAGSYFDSNPLLSQERDLVERGRQHVFKQNPQFFLSSRNPPLGETPNIRSVNGDTLVLKNGASLGSAITHIPYGYAGTTTDSGAALLANAGKYNLELSNTAQGFGGGRQALLNSPTISSIMMTLRRELTSKVHAFVEIDRSGNSGRYVRNFVNVFPVLISSNAPNNPFQQAVAVSVPTVGADANLQSSSESHRAIAGVIFKVSKNWQAEADFTWNRSRFEYSFPANIAPSGVAQVNNGTIDVLRDVNVFPIDYTPLLDKPVFTSPADSILRDSTLRFAGPLPWMLPAGHISFSGLLEYRKESYRENTLSLGGFSLLYPGRKQEVDSAYIELGIPLFSARNRRSGMESLDLQLAIRRDEYDVQGSTNSINLGNPVPVERFTTKLSSVDHTFGVRYQPMSDFTVRASYGTGFRPPGLHELAPSFESLSLDLSHLQDPRRGNESLGLVTVSGEGSGDLQPEKSRSWSVGAILQPRFLSDLRLSLDWTKIEKHDNITFVTEGDQSTFDIEAAVPGVVVRAPSSPDDSFGVGPVIAFNTGLYNIARLEVDAIDVSLGYTLKSERLGDFSFTLGATRLFSLETQLTSVTPAVEHAGVSEVLSPSEAGGLKWRANSSVKWRYGNWTLGWVTRFFDSYFLNSAHTIDPNQGSATVPSQIYHDLFGRYYFEPVGGESKFTIFSDVEIQFGVNNIFNKSPPVDVLAGQLSGLYYSRWADPRGASYYLSVRKSFTLR